MNENGQLASNSSADPRVRPRASRPFEIAKVKAIWNSSTINSCRSISRFVARKIREMERTQCHSATPVKSPQRLLHRLAYGSSIFFTNLTIVSPRVVPVISKLYAFCHAFVAEKTRKIGIFLSSTLFYRTLIFLKRLYFSLSLFFLLFSFFLSFFF